MFGLKRGIGMICLTIISTVAIIAIAIAKKGDNHE